MARTAVADAMPVHRYAPVRWFGRKVGQAGKLKRLAPVQLYRHGLRHGVAATVEHGPALSRLPLRTVVDIGASRGQFSLYAAATFPSARIYAFEPLPQPARTFRKVFAGIPRVTLCEVAVGPERRKISMNVSRRDDSSSLLPIGAAQRAIFPGTAHAGAVSVSVAPLTDFIDADALVAPALMKLDVQGFELSALRASRPLLDAFDVIYAECSFIELYDGQALAPAVIEFCADEGFDLAGVHNIAYHRGAAVQGDFLFRRRSL